MPCISWRLRDKKTGREEPLIAIQEQAIKDGMKNANEYSCKYIRQVWKNKGFTSYNDDAAYARYRITNQRPPQLSFKDKKFLKNIVIRVMRIFNQIKEPERSNSLYYAYVLYKVINQFFVNRDEIRLLDSIHIQKDETLVYNDRQYEKICDEHNKYFSPKLIYKPTVPEEVAY